MSQSFIVYLFKGDQADFRRHFDRKFSLDFKPQVSLSFSKPNADVASRYSADSPTDILVTVTPRGTLSSDEEQRVIEAVQYAARETGSAMSPVR